MSKKILVIRFSAMGDVVLTSPVLRCIRQTYPDCELHFLVKEKFRDAIENNTHLHHLHVFKKHPREVVEQLRGENFDYVADLQRNRKSAWLRRNLKTRSGTFPKLNLRKFLLTTFKIDLMPRVHVVERYFKAVAPIGVYNDHKGLEFFAPETGDVPAPDEQEFLKTAYVALVLGATYYTKRIPEKKLEEILSHLKMPVVLLGGPAEAELAERLEKKFRHARHLAGKTTLAQTAWYIRSAQSVITSDTGLMHIAAAYGKKTISVWGNTVPGFGMGPYIPQQPANALVVEVKNLPCRPCSKLGHDRCPEKHFCCMLQHDAKKIAALAEEGL